MQYAKYILFISIILISLSTCRTGFKEGMGIGADDKHNVQFDPNSDELDKDLVCELLDEEGKVIEEVSHSSLGLTDKSDEENYQERSRRVKKRDRQILSVLFALLGVIGVIITFYGLSKMIKYFAEQCFK